MQKQSLSNKDIFTSFKKGQRNGNWRRLGFLDKALCRTVMWYLKRGGSIVNGKLVEKHFFQKEIFTKETIKKYSKVREDTIRAFL